MSRTLAALFIAAGTLAALAAPAPAADLGATNTVVATSTSYTEVTLTREVVIDHLSHAEQNKTFRVQGGGRFGGVMLRQVGVPEEQAATAIAIRFDPAYFCGQDCARPAPLLAVSSIGANFDPKRGYTLPPGRYRLYGLADSGEVRATLTFPELSGERSFKPETPHNAKLQELPARNAAMKTADEVYAFGDTVAPKEPSVVFDASMLYYGAKAGVAYFYCRYEGAPTHPLSFYPTCPAEQGQLVHSLLLLDNVIVPGPSALAIVGSIFLKPGTYGLGGNYTSAGLVDSAGAVALTIPVGPPSSGESAPPVETPAPSKVVEGAQQRTVIPTSGQQGEQGKASSVTAAPARLTLASRKLRAKRNRVAIPLRCTGKTTCRGRIVLGSTTKTVKIAAGRRATIKLTLPSRTVRTLRSRAATTLKVSLIDAGGVERTQRVRVSR